MQATTTRIKRITLATASSLLLLAGMGCAHRYGSPPPPPPPGGAQLSPLIELANRNGLQTGRNDGARDVAHGVPYRARKTRAYHDAPGYDPHLGPFGPYRDVFRSAYQRGYDQGYRRR